MVWVMRAWDPFSTRTAFCGPSNSRIASPGELRVCSRQATLRLSAASRWEIAIKARAGKLDVPKEPKFFARHMDTLGLQPLAVQTWHVNRIFVLPDHHKDPFDRLLVAQAQVESLTILTADPVIGRYDVKTLW